MIKKIVTLWSKIEVIIDKILVVIRTTRHQFLVVHSHFLVVADTWTRRFS